jgi:U4/U6.U5 tri-snRNP component SNU23
LSYLKKRDDESLILKQTELDLKETPSAYYCKICNCSLKDNQAYLDHVNGKRHNLMLGMNMKVEKVGVDKVRERLLNLKRQNENPMKSKNDLEKLSYDKCGKSDKEKELEEIGNEPEVNNIINNFKK